jgi:hypothetical protein
MALDVDQFLHKWKTDPAGTPPRLINDLPAPEATEAFNFSLVGSGAAYCRTAYTNQLCLIHINT